MLARKELDFALSSLHMLPERDAVMDFGYPYDLGGLHIFQPKPIRIFDALAIVHPFHASTWMVTFTMLTIVGGLYLLLQQSKQHHDTMEHGADQNVKAIKLPEIAFALLSILLKQAPKYGKNGLRSSIFIELWGILTIILGIAYSTLL